MASAKNPTDGARVRLAALCAQQDRAADIARILGVSDKAMRGRIRAGRIATFDAHGATVTDDDGKMVALPPVHVSRDGLSALTDTHKRSIAFAYVADDESAHAVLTRLSK